jgi:hypothetical protein
MLQAIRAKLICFLGVIIFITACEKDTPEEEPPQPTVYTFTAPDSLVFEHIGTKQIEISIQSSKPTSLFGAILKDVNGIFVTSSQEIQIPANESRTINVRLTQNSAPPGAYPAVLEVWIYNENMVYKNKTIQLVYAPNCAYTYRNHQNGQITYVLNGIPQNKTITCAYNDEGQLVVTGLTPYQVKLNFDCAAQTVTMQPLTHNGDYMTGTGMIEGDEIVLQMFSDGVVHSNSRIRI